VIKIFIDFFPQKTFFWLNLQCENTFFQKNSNFCHLQNKNLSNKITGLKLAIRGRVILQSKLAVLVSQSTSFLFFLKLVSRKCFLITIYFS